MQNSSGSICRSIRASDGVRPVWANGESFADKVLTRPVTPHQTACLHDTCKSLSRPQAPNQEQHNQQDPSELFIMAHATNLPKLVKARSTE
eukprot:1707144-Amphidinium_carterae.1